MGKVVSKESSEALPLAADSIVADYRLAFRSRQASLLGRKEVLTGKAKFGIFGDGKEIAQVALSHSFAKGDVRSGYYRDQTIAFALGFLSVREFFASIYADPDLVNEPSSGGRQMNGHFATRNLNPDGSWKNLTEMFNCSADVSPTGSQMPRMVGLSYSSVLYRNLPELKAWVDSEQFSINGNEICWGTIGNASCAEGMFWESVNAVGVLRAPLLLSIWDDGYGISVPNRFQVTKDNVGELLTGFQRKGDDRGGYEIFTVRAWDYAALVETYRKAAKLVREEHVPAIVHVIEVTQPQGHSTSGSHERYKSKERLAWEDEFDGIRKMREYMIANGVSTAEQLDAMEEEEKKNVRDEQKQAWKDFADPVMKELKTLSGILQEMSLTSANAEQLQGLISALGAMREPMFRDLMEQAHKALLAVRTENLPATRKLLTWKQELNALKYEQYSSHLHSENSDSVMSVPQVAPVYGSEATQANAFEIAQKFWDKILTRDPRVFIFGEDVGGIGGVNQTYAGLQDKHGKLRVADTGIRECTIVGQAIGMSMRGLRPVAEIQYLDYILYGLQLMSDDLATVRWRTKGGQKAPAIITTRGHRLEGIWHSGSPMAGIIHLVRGMYVCVPRNMVQTCGMYNTLLRSEEPAIVVEVLNGYRRKEALPENLGEYTVELGEVEILREGTDITIVTYGPLCRIAETAAEQLASVGISVELIDVQTLLPFDRSGRISESLKKTNRILFLDEDVPGGVTSYMMQEVLEKQGGYYWLDSEPRTLAAKPHRPAYGSDGDYWSKPSAEDIFETVYDLMHETDPVTYPVFYK